jgi:hypothetical protein
MYSGRCVRPGTREGGGAGASTFDLPKFGDRVEGKGMKNGFGSELISAKLASSKKQPMSYKDPLYYI